MIQKYTLTTPPNSFYECGFYQTLKEYIDSALRVEYIQDLLTFSNKRDRSSTTPSNATSTSTGGSFNALLSVLLLVEDMIGVYPIYVINHSTSLITLAQRLLTEHLNKVRTTLNIFLKVGKLI